MSKLIQIIKQKFMIKYKEIINIRNKVLIQKKMNNFFYKKFLNNYNNTKYI